MVKGPNERLTASLGESLWAKAKAKRFSAKTATNKREFASQHLQHLRPGLEGQEDERNFLPKEIEG